MNKYIKNLNNIQDFLNKHSSNQNAQVALNAMLTSFHNDGNYQWYISNPVDKYHIAYTENLIKDLKRNTKDPLAICTYDYNGSSHHNLKILKQSKNIFSHYPNIKAPVTVNQVNHLIDLAKTKVVPNVVKANHENRIADKALNNFENALVVQIERDDSIQRMLSIGRYDKRPCHINDVLYPHTLKDILGVEDGETYRKDIKEENDDWFSENDPDSMKNKDYKEFIQRHQNHFNPDYVYPMADDIDDYPEPLTHRQLLKRCQESYL